ncbi:RNA polymerase subunit sigma [Ventosimonas gracilis]|uniref:RNA polymerase subunit sigma n=1 Tax=Ventosimonas gracilis TaxID=1680762 RepID=A0A139SUR7_9GAMM|nr:sigma-70 family RNA polymerase sigma factor [Ventosimonas gracilis]KXU38346.1 RNA polymerase subunit sigma [Ventosimonas gracilis]
MPPDIMRTLSPLIPALRRYARALLHDAWDADDLVQDCLERAIGRWHQCRDDGNARAWVFTILHNLAMTRLRRATRQPRMLPIDGAEPASIRATQEEHLHCQDVMSALAHLPDEQRSVLLLIAVEDLSYLEAAKVLDIPVGTVMSRLSRARDRLHRLLSGESTRAPLRIVKNAMNGE